MDPLLLASTLMRSTSRPPNSKTAEDAYYNRHRAVPRRLVPIASAFAAAGLGALSLGLFS
jgi:hypothetical protein